MATWMLNENMINGYVLGDKINHGRFGIVYKCTRDGETFAVKCEDKSHRTSKDDKSFLKKEYDFYKTYLNKSNYLVMQLLGPDLRALFTKSVFSEPCIILITINMIDILEEVHSYGLIYQDIKPDNILITNNINDPIKLYLTDFGLSKYYLDSESNHVKFNITRQTIGTPRYMSIHAHNREEMSRRDDMEGLIYVAAQFIVKVLPWQGLRPEKDENNPDKKSPNITDLILPVKEKHRFDVFPHPYTSFKTYLIKVTQLRFEEKPDYSLLKQIILDGRDPESLYFDWFKDTTTTISNTATIATSAKKKRKRKFFKFCI
ncbi:MAG: Palmitoylated plasma membrane-bound casein kinase [Marteilia pararefringens]